MANKRRRKRKLKSFTKVLMVLIPCFVVVGVIYSIDSNKIQDNKIEETKTDTKINNDNIVKDSNTQDNNTSIDETEEDPNDIYGILESISKTDYRYKEVLANKDIYPEKLLEMLSRNKDMISYMYDFDIYVSKSITNIQIISNDETTIYQTITSTFEVGKFYNITQMVEIV